MTRMRTTHMRTAPFPNTSNPLSPIGPDELNDAYKYGQFWVPAGALTIGQTNPATKEEYESSAGGNSKPTWTVVKYSGTLEQEAYFQWDFFADFVAVPSASMLLKISPKWFAKTTASNPNNVVEFEGGAYNLLVGSSVNFNVTPETAMEQIVPATAFDLQAGKTGDVTASIPLTVGGGVVSASEWNSINILLERHGDEDSFADDVFLMGFGVQFAVDFNHVGIWPT